METPCFKFHCIYSFSGICVTHVSVHQFRPFSETCAVELERAGMRPAQLTCKKQRKLSQLNV